MDARLWNSSHGAVVSLLPALVPRGMQAGPAHHPIYGRVESNLVRIDGRLSLDRHPA